MGRLTPPPPPIEHRSMEYHYTKLVLHIAKCTYTQDKCIPPPINHRSMKNHYTISVSHTAKCIYMKAPLLQLTIDTSNATILNKFHI